MRISLCMWQIWLKAAIATIRRELDSRLKTVGVVVLQCSVAWVVALAAYAIAGLV